jgi:hypothetical protein
MKVFAAFPTARCVAHRIADWNFNWQDQCASSVLLFRAARQ